MSELDNILMQLEELKNDRRVPKNVRSSIEKTLAELQKADENIDIKLNTSISILDEVSNDTNIQPFTRTQIWNLVSMLEAYHDSLN